MAKDIILMILMILTIEQENLFPEKTIGLNYNIEIFDRLYNGNLSESRK